MPQGKKKGNTIWGKKKIHNKHSEHPCVMYPIDLHAEKYVSLWKLFWWSKEREVGRTETPRV